jgi:hypothetical protein
MAPYGVVFQLLALVQWRARAQAHYTCTQLPCQSQRETGWARLTVNPSLPGGLRGWPVWLSATQSWAQCSKPATTKWPTWAKWLHMCQWWAAAHKFELEVTSNLIISTGDLKLETWQQRLQQVHALDQGRRRSAEKQSPLTAQHVGDGEAGGRGAAGSWRPQPAPSRRAGDMI